MSAVLALDLSLTATGIAHPAGTLQTYTPHGKGDWRLINIIDAIRQATLAVDLVAIEGPVTRSQAATILGMVHGAVRVDLMHHDIPYLVVTPGTLKKYATGKGNAPKPTMRMELYKRTELDVPDDNQVDAAWLRLLTLDLLGHPEITMPAHNRAVLDNLRLALPAHLRPTEATS